MQRWPCFVAGQPARAEEQPCKPYSFEGNAYTLCEAPLNRFSIRLFWQRPDGAPYSYLSALPKTDANGGRLAFALNGGMFHPDYKPVGLYIEDGRELVRANTRSGPGNFHLKPNGIFYAGEGEAGVLETGAFLKKKPNALFATQSGPMLVVDGKLHPRIAKANVSAKARDGVCVRGAGVVLFRDFRGRGALRYVRAPVPRWPQMPQRAVSGRRDRPRRSMCRLPLAAETCCSGWGR